MPTERLEPVSDGIRLADVHYQNETGIIGCGVVETADGILLVDPGPDPSIPNLIDLLAGEGIQTSDLHAVLLTHIHLDHAGGTGSLLAQQPDLIVYVHEKGAPHMVDPERLIKSAARIYGDRMEQLWGRFLPVPRENVVVLKKRRRIAFGRKVLLTESTPGHASHHIAYLDESTGTAFTGDVAGIRMRGTSYVMPVAPPPDIDVEAWEASIRTVRSWRPERLVPTHFGAYDDVEQHLDALEAELASWSAWVKKNPDSTGDAGSLNAFDAFVRETMPDEVVNLGAEPYHPYGQVEATLHGLARYWRKKKEAEADE